MKILIIEDEQPACSRLIRLIKNFNASYEVVACLDSVEESITWFTENEHPDLVFLDIQLSDGNSFQVLHDVGFTSPVIFTTSHAEYIASSFEAFTIDYLFKPIKREAFNTAMLRFLQRRPSGKHPTDESVTLKENWLATKELVKVGNQLTVLDLHTAAYFIYEEKATVFVGQNGKKYVLNHSLDQLERILDPLQFHRINRQCIINGATIDKIITYSKSRLKLTTKTPKSIDLQVSAERTPTFKKWLLQSKV